MINTTLVRGGVAHDPTNAASTRAVATRANLLSLGDDALMILYSFVICG